MSPSGARLNNLVEIHCVMDQGISALGKLNQFRPPVRRHFIRAAGAQLVVGHVHDFPSSCRRYETITECGARMPEPEGTDAEIIEVELAFTDLDHRQRSGESI